MPLTKARRPKYERQDIKQNLFTIQLSYQRLNKIQRLLKEKDVDALLIIIGIDGRFNSGSLEVFNYLLFDVYGTRRDDINRSKLDDDIFDDLMICIHCDETHVCCNGANYWLLLPYISHWPGLRLHCISELEMEDPDKVEEFKMKTFVEMTRRCSKIAVSIKASYESNNEPFDPMQLEDWPIVQSYAFDDFGKYSNENSKKGFFTLVHKVVDLSHEISGICRQIDPVYLESVYVKILPQIEGLFENIFQLLDTKCFNKDFEINEEALEEPVNSYYSHYKGANVTLLDKIKMWPFVLTGTNTRKQILLNKMANKMEKSRDKVMKNPTHLIIQCLSLQTGIVIARTAFLKGSSSADINDSATSFIADDIKELSKVYRMLIKSVEYVVNTIKESRKLNLDTINGGMYLKSILEDTEYSEYIFRIQRVDDESQLDCSMIIIQGVVFDVINRVTKMNLGSVMFADTFAVSSVPLRQNEDLSSVLRLGKEVPVFGYWTDQRLSEVHSLINSMYQLDSLGTETVNIFLPDDNFHDDMAHNACCTFYPDRVLLFNRRIGASLIYPLSVEIFEGESYGDWTICTIKFQKDEDSSNWIWNNQDRCTLHLVFTNHSSSRKFLANVVIPQWKDKIPITYTEKIRCHHLLKSWTNLQLWMSSHQLSDSDVHNQSIIDGITDDASRCSLAKFLQPMGNSLFNKRSCLRIFCRFLELAYSLHYLKTLNYIEQIPNVNIQFYESLEQSWKTVSIMDLTKLETVKTGPVLITDSQVIIVTVLCGLPGSGHDIVTRKITKLIKEDISWIMVDANTLDNIPYSIDRAISSFCKLESTDDRKQMRMILLAPSMCSPAIICELLAGLSTRIPLVIGSTCFCIDPQAAYQDGNELTIAGLLDMCNEGWVTCILLTGADDNSKQTDNLHRLLHSRNDLCTIFRSPKAEVNKELDTILSPVAFQQSRFASARIMIGASIVGSKESFSGIRKIAPELFEVTFPLYGNLLKKNIMATCKEIFKHIEPSPFERNIYFIDGIFGMEDDSRFLFSFNAVALTKQISFTPIKKTLSGDNSICENRGNFIRVYTTNVNFNFPFDSNDSEKIENWKNQLLAILRKCQRHQSESKRKLTLSDLTKSHLDDIHKQRHLETLPEGWFYNGLTYVHMDGTRSDKHPRLPMFIDDYLLKENGAIEEHNSAIEKMSFPDSFGKC